MPPAILAVTAKLLKVPTEVMLFCAAVVNVPKILVPDRLPPEMLPTAKINPDATKLAPLTLARVLTLPVAITAPAVTMLLPVTLPDALTLTALTSAELIILPPSTLPVAETLPVALTAPEVIMFPELTLPAAETSPVVLKLPDWVLPATVSKFGPAVSNVNPAEAPALPALLKITCVFDPGTTKLPVILPAKLPTKYPAVVILPADDIWPAVVKFPPATLPVAVTVLGANAPVMLRLPPAMLAAVVMLPVAVI